MSAQPAKTLRLALEKAVGETWIDPEMRLLLSGGLDSRIVLALAAGKRKTLTIELYSKEAEMARKVAASADSELELVPPPDYHYPMRWAYLVTGAMHDSQYVSHLGLVQDWRARGIPKTIALHSWQRPPPRSAARKDFCARFVRSRTNSICRV